ncbi:MAG: substrate-binding periplasmic protein [Cellvibrionaceae bacterium]
MSFFSDYQRIFDGGRFLKDGVIKLCQALALCAFWYAPIGTAKSVAVISSSEDLSATVKTQSLISPELDSRPVLNVCVFEWKPYSYFREGQIEGVLIDFVRAMDLPYSLQFNVMPLPRCRAAVRQGRQDLMLYNSTPDPDLVLAKIPVQYHISGVVVTATSDHKGFEGLPQFSGQTLGVLRGNPIYTSLKHYDGVDWQLQNSGKSMWQMLMRGRLDGAIGDFLSLTPLEVYRSGEVEFLQPALYATPIYMAVHRSKAAEIIPSINKHLQQFLDEGLVDEAYVRHGVVPFSRVKAMAVEFEQHQREKQRKAGAIVERH